MENEPQSQEDENFVAPETNGNELAETPEVETGSINELPARLGYVETAELNSIKAQLVEAVRTGEAEMIAQLANQRRDIAEAMIDGLPEENKVAATIGLNIDTGLIYKAAGEIDDYAAELEDALEQAENMGYQEIAEQILQALRSL